MSVDPQTSESRLKLRARIFGVGYLLLALGMIGFWTWRIWDHDLWLTSLVMLFLWSGFLAAFALITGFEVAYLDLRDKDLTQLTSALQPRFSQMQERQRQIVEAKEWLVVLITVGLALMAEWHFEVHWLRLLHHEAVVPREDLNGVRLAFVLFFTTVPIVWLSLGPAKVYAMENSERFLARWSWCVWPVVRGVGLVIGRLHLATPSEIVLRLWGTVPKRSLGISLGAYYMMTVQRFLHANHRVIERISIDQEGAATVKLDIVAVVLPSSAPTRVFKGQLKNPEGVKSGRVIVHWAGDCAPPREQHRDFDAQMRRLESYPPSKYAPSVLKTATNGTADGEDFLIELPFDWQSDSTMFTMRYAAEFEVNPKGFVGLPGENDRDDYSRVFDWPCYNYTLILEFEQNSRIRFAHIKAVVSFGGTPHERESKRVTEFITGHGTHSVRIEIPFPLVGATYKFEWTVWRES